MALITCPKCGKRISDRAVKCPQCGISQEEVHRLIEEEKAREAAEQERLCKEREAKEAEEKRLRAERWKKNRKYVFLIIFIITCAIAYIPISTYLHTPKWKLEDGVLTISPHGIFSATMKDYENHPAPWGKEVRTVIIEEGVKNIGAAAFDGNEELESVVIPNSVARIGSHAFHGCGRLSSVSIPNSVTNIEESTFEGCRSLRRVTIPNSVTSIENNAFHGCTFLNSVTILDGVSSIGDSVFYLCEFLNSVTLPNSVTSIGNEAFGVCCHLTSVTIPNSVTSIGNGAFNCVYNIEYSGTAKGAPWGASHINCFIDGWLIYSDASKTDLIKCFRNAEGEITIPNSVTSIGWDAFLGCYGLTSIEIPNSVMSIGNWAFNYCTSLNIKLPERFRGKVELSACKSVTYY